VNAILVEKRIPEEERNSGLYYYGVRHSDDDWGKPVTIEVNVRFNFYGTLITDEPLRFPEGKDYIVFKGNIKKRIKVLTTFFENLNKTNIR